MMNVKLLDCTLRDGGQGIEDLNKNGIKTKLFSEQDRLSISMNLVDASIDIIELGCIVKSNQDTTQYAIYQSIEEISHQKLKKGFDNQMFVGLFIGPDIDIGEVPEHNESLIDGVRVILRYSELQKSLNFCRGLAEKGYKVFIQPMLTMRYTEKELDMIINEANSMDAFALYFVDSFGYMNEADIGRFYKLFDSKLKKNIHIGFHAHNNMDMASENVHAFLRCAMEGRNVIVDSCAIGMGQGAGNMQTELIAPFLNEKFGNKYNFEKILNVCEVIERFRIGEMATWGYSPIRAISAIHKAAYKYAVVMRVQKGMSLSEINKAFEVMPSNLKHRYTKENLEAVLQLL